MNDVIIVGGGLAGLAAAAYCARAGVSVKVLERGTQVGGRARTDWERGHAFNQGGHALYRSGAASRVLKELGVAFTGGKPAAKGLVAIARGEVHRLPSDLVSMLATDLFGFAAKVETARALAAVARTDPAPLRDVPWSEWARRIAPRPEVRAALSALMRVTTYANAPERASAGATIAQMKMGLDPGVLYLDSGWQTLVDGLDQCARNAGARILPGARVTAVAREGGDGPFVVALEKGVTFRAHAVILATGPATARTLLRAPALGADLVTLRTACLDLGLSALPRPDRAFALGIDRPTYFSVHSASARLAEVGATVHVMKYLDPDATQDPRADEQELEAVTDLMQPGWRTHVVAKRFLPNLVATNALVTAGSRRPEADATGVPGAFVAGDWVGQEGMLADTALASAKKAAELAVAEANRTPLRPARAEGTMATQ
jgi:phytoene dehydrogenase-like protein